MSFSLDYQFLLENLPMPVCLLNQDLYIKVASFSFKKLYFKKAESNYFLNALHNEDAKKFFTSIKLARNNKASSLNLRSSTDNKYYLVSVIPKEEYILIYAEDVTKINLLENESLISKKEALEYTQLVSHDLKAPLRQVYDYINLFKKEITDIKLNEDAKLYLNTIEKCSLKMTTMIDGISKISLIKPEDAHLKKFSLKEYLLKLVSEIYPRLNIHIQDLCEDHFYGDYHLIDHIFLNLIQNSINFNNEKVRIDIEIYKIFNRIQIDYTDNGIGISQNIQGTIFRPFHKSGNSTGLGLGLSIVERAMLALKGSIECINQGEQGAHFQLKFPLAPSAKK